MTGRSATPLAIVALTLGGGLTAVLGDGYTPFVLALVALTTVVGVGLNILVGLSGQFSIGHVGFYAIGAYVVGILTLKGVSFWLALPAAGRRTLRSAGLRANAWSAYVREVFASCCWKVMSAMYASAG